MTKKTKLRYIGDVPVTPLNKSVELKVYTKLPSKWMLSDLETGQRFIGKGKKDELDWMEIKKDLSTIHHGCLTKLQLKSHQRYESAMMGFTIGIFGLLLTLIIAVIAS